MTVLDEALEAHGGLARWRQMNRAQGTLESRGLLFEAKIVGSPSPPLQFAVATQEVWASLKPGASAPSIELTPERLVVVSDDGTVLAEKHRIRESFAGHEFSTPWDPVQRGYFGAYALWNYLNLPFMLILAGVVAHELGPIEVDGEILHGVAATFPEDIPTHSREQQFYFDADRLRKLHRYHVDIAGAVPVNHYVSDYVNAQGINVPTTRRAYRRDDRGRTCWDELLVHLQFSDVTYSAAP